MSEFDSPDPTDTADSADSTDFTDPAARDEQLLCDVMCGSLVTYLRMCGYDTAYALDREVEADDRLLELAQEEGRTLLTRDRQLAARARAAGARDADDGESERDAEPGTDAEFGIGGLLLDSREVIGQLHELRDAGYTLTLAERPTHCGRCNGPVEAVDENERTPEYAPEPGTENVWRCVECDQHFWKGSHWESVRRTLADR